MEPDPTGSDPDELAAMLLTWLRVQFPEPLFREAGHLPPLTTGDITGSNEHEQSERPCIVYTRAVSSGVLLPEILHAIDPIALPSASIIRAPRRPKSESASSGAKPHILERAPRQQYKYNTRKACRALRQVLAKAAKKPEAMTNIFSMAVRTMPKADPVPAIHLGELVIAAAMYGPRSEEFVWGVWNIECNKTKFALYYSLQRSAKLLGLPPIDTLYREPITDVKTNDEGTKDGGENVAKQHGPLASAAAAAGAVSGDTTAFAATVGTESRRASSTSTITTTTTTTASSSPKRSSLSSRRKSNKSSPVAVMKRPSETNSSHNGHKDVMEDEVRRLSNVTDESEDEEDRRADRKDIFSRMREEDADSDSDDDKERESSFRRGRLERRVSGLEGTRMGPKGDGYWETEARLKEIERVKRVFNELDQGRSGSRKHRHSAPEERTAVAGMESSANEKALRTKSLGGRKEAQERAKERQKLSLNSLTTSDGDREASVLGLDFLAPPAVEVEGSTGSYDSYRNRQLQAEFSIDKEANDVRGAADTSNATATDSHEYNEKQYEKIDDVLQDGRQPHVYTSERSNVVSEGIAPEMEEEEREVYDESHEDGAQVNESADGMIYDEKEGDFVKGVQDRDKESQPFEEVITAPEVARTVADEAGGGKGEEEQEAREDERNDRTTFPVGSPSSSGSHILQSPGIVEDVDAVAMSDPDAIAADIESTHVRKNSSGTHSSSASSIPQAERGGGDYSDHRVSLMKHSRKLYERLMNMWEPAKRESRRSRRQGMRLNTEPEENHASGITSSGGAGVRSSEKGVGEIESMRDIENYSEIHEQRAGKIDTFAVDATDPRTQPANQHAGDSSLSAAENRHTNDVNVDKNTAPQNQSTTTPATTAPSTEQFTSPQPISPVFDTDRGPMQTQAPNIPASRARPPSRLRSPERMRSPSSTSVVEAKDKSLSPRTTRREGHQRGKPSLQREDSSGDARTKSKKDAAVGNAQDRGAPLMSYRPLRRATRLTTATGLAAEHADQARTAEGATANPLHHSPYDDYISTSSVTSDGRVRVDRTRLDWLMQELLTARENIMNKDMQLTIAAQQTKEKEEILILEREEAENVIAAMKTLLSERELELETAREKLRYTLKETDDYNSQAREREDRQIREMYNSGIHNIDKAAVDRHEKSVAEMRQHREEMKQLLEDRFGIIVEQRDKEITELKKELSRLLDETGRLGQERLKLTKENSAVKEEVKAARQDKDLVIAQAAMEISQVQAKLELVDKFSKKLADTFKETEELRAQVAATQKQIVQASQASTAEGPLREQAVRAQTELERMKEMLNREKSEKEAATQRAADLQRELHERQRQVRQLRDLNARLEGPRMTDGSFLSDKPKSKKKTKKGSFATIREKLFGRRAAPKGAKEKTDNQGPTDSSYQQYDRSRGERSPTFDSARPEGTGFSSPFGSQSPSGSLDPGMDSAGYSPAAAGSPRSKSDEDLKKDSNALAHKTTTTRVPAQEFY